MDFKTNTQLAEETFRFLAKDIPVEFALIDVETTSGLKSASVYSSLNPRFEKKSGERINNLLQPNFSENILSLRHIHSHPNTISAISGPSEDFDVKSRNKFEHLKQAKFYIYDIKTLKDI